MVFSMFQEHQVQASKQASKQAMCDLTEASGLMPIIALMTSTKMMLVVAV